MPPLDNVIWQALTTRQAGFAQVFDQARAFPREVSPLTAFLEPNQRGYESVAGLVGTGGTAALFFDAPYEPRKGWERLAGAPLLQMVCDNGVAGDDLAVDATDIRTRPRGLPGNAGADRINKTRAVRTPYP